MRQFLHFVRDLGKETVGALIVKHAVSRYFNLGFDDSIVDLEYLEKSYEDGLRALGPAHYGPGVYAFGTDSTGGLGNKGNPEISL